MTDTYPAIVSAFWPPVERSHSAKNSSVSWLYTRLAMSPARSTGMNGTRPVALKYFLKCVNAVPSLPQSHSSRPRRRTLARRAPRRAAWPVAAAPCAHSSAALSPSGPSNPHSLARRSTFASPAFSTRCSVAETAASSSVGAVGAAARPAAGPRRSVAVGPRGPASLGSASRCRGDRDAPTEPSSRWRHVPPHARVPCARPPCGCSSPADE